MYSPRWTSALPMMALLAMPVVGANAQPISTSGGAVVEVTVEPLRNGKIPREVECVEKVKVVKGTASIQTFTGKRRELHENEEVCITPSGDLKVSLAQIEIPSFSSAGVTPPCVPVSGSTTCQ
jgi:hypothetical protein